jgi:hypothetical protein
MKNQITTPNKFQNKYGINNDRILVFNFDRYILMSNFCTFRKNKNPEIKKNNGTAMAAITSEKNVDIIEKNGVLTLLPKAITEVLVGALWINTTAITKGKRKKSITSEYNFLLFKFVILICF